MKRNLACWFLLFNCQILIPQILSAQEDQNRFERISIQEGLAQSTVNCILMDRQGFMWFGTANGLNRYDGYSIKRYQTSLDDVNSLSHFYVQDLYEVPSDSVHLMWVATSGGGLNLFNMETEKFKRYQHKPDNLNGLSHDLLHSICPGDSGYLWIGTWGGGIDILNPKNDTFSHLRHTVRRYEFFIKQLCHGNNS